MSSKRFVTTVVGFGALAASVMVLPGVLDASSNEVRPVPMGVEVDGTTECREDGGFEGTTGVKVEAPFEAGEVIEVDVDGGTITFEFSNPNDEGEPLTVTVTFSGSIIGVGIVGKAGQAVEVDADSPFSLTFTQGISNVSACFTTGSTTTTASTTTTTTGDSTTTTTGDSTTTTTGGSTTTTGDSTTTTTGGSSTTTGGSSTVVPPPSTMPNTGAGDSSNLIGAALLALMAGGLALLLSRRRAA